MDTAIMTKRINKSLVVNGTTVVTETAWNEELNAKHEKLVEWLREQQSWTAFSFAAMKTWPG